MLINGIKIHKNFNDISGQRFGRLTALYPIGSHGRHRGVVWMWECDCGNKIERVSHDIKAGHTTSCGCARGGAFGESSFNALYNSYKDNANKRKIQFCLTKDEFRQITEQDCFYCGREPSQIKTHRLFKGHYIYNGIDRWNNSIGYVWENCVPCCGVCNTMKMDRSAEEFLSQVSRIYKFRNP